MASGSGYGVKKDEVYGFRTLYRELGYYISRLEQHERALRFFDDALKKTPNDKRALLGRAAARSKACQYEGALADIRKALNLDPDDLVVLAHKALNTYLSCEFEDGLVQNTRLIPKRKKPDCFRMGQMHCTDAIENCLGDRAGRPLRDHYHIIRNLAWKRNAEAQKPYEPKSKFKKKKKEKRGFAVQELIVPVQGKKLKEKNVTGESAHVSDEIGEEPPDSPEDQIRDNIYSLKSAENVLAPYKPFPFKPLQNYTSNIENYIAEKYLETLSKDKQFLKNLETRSGILCPNKSGSAKIVQLAKFGYKTVKYKQELMRTRRPFYFIKYQEATSSGALKLRQEMALRTIQEAARKEANALVMKMRDAVAERKLKHLLDLVEKLKTFCDSKSRKILPERDIFLATLYDSVAQGYFDLKRLNKTQYEWDQEKRIHVMLGMGVSREPSTDSVIEQFKNVFVDWKKQVTVFSDRLRKASSPEETAWLYHELSRFHSELKQYELSRVYAKKCVAEGKRSNDQRWIINGMMLLIKNNIQQHNKNDAKVDCKEAIEVAKTINNEELKNFFNKCSQVIEKADFDDDVGLKIIEQREKKIVQLMADDKAKDDASHLFRMMSAMPAARRMSVMPGIRPVDDEGEKGFRGSSRRMSVMPTAKPVDDVKPIATKVKRSKRQDSKGKGFVELIQYHIDT